MTKEALAKFKAIYTQEFGVELSDEDALVAATNFLNLMREVISPVPGNKNE